MCRFYTHATTLCRYCHLKIDIIKDVNGKENDANFIKVRYTY